MSAIPIEPTDHAIVRYGERVKPALARAALERDIRRALDLAEISPARPEWIHPDTDQERPASAWALLSDGIAFPLHRESTGIYRAVSCITRAGMAAPARAYKSRKRRNRRQVKRIRSSKSAARHEANRRKRGVIS